MARQDRWWIMTLPGKGKAKPARQKPGPSKTRFLRLEALEPRQLLSGVVNLAAVLANMTPHPHPSGDLPADGGQVVPLAVYTPGLVAPDRGCRRPAGPPGRRRPGDRRWVRIGRQVRPGRPPGRRRRREACGSGPPGGGSGFSTGRAFRGSALPCLCPERHDPPAILPCHDANLPFWSAGIHYRFRPAAERLFL